MGTPTNQVWPGVTDLTDYKSTFPKWNAQDLGTVMKNQLTTAGVDVLKVYHNCFYYWEQDEFITY